MVFKCLNPILQVVADFDLLKSLSNGKILKPWFYYNQIKNNESLKKLVLDFIFRKKIYVINCRKCNSCLNWKRNDWIKRTAIEKLKWDHAYFLTFTFDNKHLTTPFLERRFFSTFFRDLKRNHFFNDEPFSYLASGEYGSLTKRKHYHCLLFTNFFFDDLEFLKKTKRGNPIYVSSSLIREWGNGFCSVALVDSPAIVRYVTKYSIKEYAKKFADNIPSPYLGEHLIVSRGYGSNINQSMLPNSIPNSIIKNLKTKLYKRKKLFESGEIGADEFFSFSKDPLNQFLLNCSAIKYNQFLNHFLTFNHFNFDKIENIFNLYQNKLNKKGEL